jgi:phage tail-like protein
MVKNALLLVLFAGAFLFGPGQAKAQETKPQFQFILRIEALNLVEPFAECSGIGSQTEIVEHKILSEDGHDIVQKIPGRLSFNNITCRRLVSANTAIWKWRERVEEGNIQQARRHGEIILYDVKGIQIARWAFFNSWPVSLKISDKDFREELVFTSEGIQRVQ